MITTHVLDTSRGRPAAGVPILLDRRDAGKWRRIGEGVTDSDGRLRTLVPDGAELEPGRFRLVFDTDHYFASQGVRGFYPEVTIVFVVDPGERHYHVPLLVSPFGYTTYRGS
jgi:5-hydroxyisourate hydrolase